MHAIQPAFPATSHSLQSWVTQFSNRRIKAKTIKSYLTGVRSAHVDIGYDDLSAFHSPKLERMIAGIRRLHGETNTQERRPITKDLLLEMLPHIDRKTREGATMYAAFCLAFAAFLRVGEFTYSPRDRKKADFDQWFLTRRSVTLFDDHLELRLPASKIDPFRRDITLMIAASGDDACPVRALRRLLTSMVCTCCTNLSLCELMFLTHFPDRLIVNSAFNYSEFNESLPIYTFSL